MLLRCLAMIFDKWMIYWKSWTSISIVMTSILDVFTLKKTIRLEKEPASRYILDSPFSEGIIFMEEEKAHIFWAQLFRLTNTVSWAGLKCVEWNSHIWCDENLAILPVNKSRILGYTSVKELLRKDVEKANVCKPIVQSSRKQEKKC